jgi:hypothetical protein
MVERKGRPPHRNLRNILEPEEPSRTQPLAEPFSAPQPSLDRPVPDTDPGQSAKPVIGDLRSRKAGRSADREIELGR